MFPKIDIRFELGGQSQLIIFLKETDKGFVADLICSIALIIMNEISNYFHM